MNLDHVVLGAILAKPALLKEVWGFEDADLDAAMTALKSGKKDKLIQWFQAKGIKRSDEILSGVLLSQEEMVIESRIRKTVKKIHSMASVHMTGRLAELNTELKGLLEKHEANAAKAREAVTAKNPAPKQDTPAKQLPTETTKATQEGQQETKGTGMQVGTGQVSGSKSGVRVPGPPRSTGGPLRTTGPSPHRKDQVGSK